jgi:hypothetical protein
MISKRILFFILVICLTLPACSAAPKIEAPTATRTIHPTRTATLIPTITFTPSPTPQMISLQATTACRAGPGEQYDLVTTVEVDTQVDSGEYYFVLLGVSDPYWLIQLPDGQQCWVMSQYVLAPTGVGTMPAFTQAATPTMFTPTGPPSPVENILVKKKKCTVQKLTDPYPHYYVEIIFILEWDDVQGEDGYWLYRDGNRVAELPVNTTQFSESFQLIKGGRTSTYYIIAYNALGQSRSPSFSFANPC